MAASIQNLPFSTAKSITQLTMKSVDAAGRAIRLSIRWILAVHFLDIMDIKEKI